MRNASSASATWRDRASASEYTATVAMPMRRAVLVTRQAISPRLAIRILAKTGRTLFLFLGALFHRLPQPCGRSEEHTSELQSRSDIVCRLLLEKKKTI